MRCTAARDPSDGERTDRALALTGTLEALAAHLERIPGPAQDAAAVQRGDRLRQGDVLGKVQRNASDVMRGMGRAIGALMRTNVALYADRSPRARPAEADLVRDAGAVAAGQRRLLRPHGCGRAERVDPDPALAVGVDRRVRGGQSQRLRRCFERIVDESSSYYVVGYSPQRAAKPGEFRSIAVKVSRPGVTISARNGYPAGPSRRRGGTPATFRCASRRPASRCRRRAAAAARRSR